MSTAVVSAPEVRPSAPGAMRAGEPDGPEASSAWKRADPRLRRVRIVSALALSVCFWYSVPYGLPKPAANSVQEAATNAAANFSGSLSRQIAMPLIAAISVFLLWRLPRRGVWRGHLRWPVIAFVGWAVVSLAWSQDPPTTGKRLIVLLCDALFAYMLARRASVPEMALWGFLTTQLVALISLGVDIFYQHSFAPFDPDYRFMGVMEANYQAMNLLVSMACAMTVLLLRPRWAKWLLPMVAIDAGLLVLTRSRLGTALALGAVAVLLVRFARSHWQARTRLLALGVLFVVVVPAAILVVGSDPERAAQRLFMMGRTDTENTQSLSNRAPLWSELFESVERNPLLGVGYAAFWTPERVERISLDQGWGVPNAHETYLDQWLSLGFVGMGLYCIALWSGCLLAWRRNRRERTPESLFIALLLTWLALESLAESVPLDPYLPTMLAYACLAKMCLLPGSEPPATQDAPLVEGLPPGTQPA